MAPVGRSCYRSLCDSSYTTSSSTRSGGNAPLELCFCSQFLFSITKEKCACRCREERRFRCLVEQKCRCEEKKRGSAAWLNKHAGVKRRREVQLLGWTNAQTEGTRSDETRICHATCYNMPQWSLQPADEKNNNSRYMRENTMAHRPSIRPIGNRNELWLLNTVNISQLKIRNLPTVGWKKKIYPPATKRERKTSARYEDTYLPPSFLGATISTYIPAYHSTARC